KGEALVPGLISYHYNDLSVEDQDIPVNYNIRKFKQYLFTPYRGGGVVEFNITKLQGFTGRLFLVKKDQRTPAEYWGLEIQVGDKTIRTVVGKTGTFYLENMPSGVLPARLFSKGQECLFDLTIPETDEIMVFLDEVICETN
ncbi:MAG: hypothetical protein IME93_02485, partial [Proteobacteria bacterium]|nr:hypothetical protein [Pseudomonadota bacterium]